MEDDVLTRLCVADHLREAGFSVLEASNGGEALAVLASFLPVEVVFSDVQMPGSLDGTELAHWTRQHHPETRVILTSAYLPKGPASDSLDGIAFIPKPYRPEEVVEQIRVELQKSSTEMIARSDTLPDVPKRRPAAL